MKVIARENGRYGITANSVAPGPIETPLLMGAKQFGEIGERIIETMRGLTQLRRLGSPEEVAERDRLPRLRRSLLRDRRDARRQRRPRHGLGGAGMGLEPGIERTEAFTVSERLVTDVGGTIGASVLSTPGMIAMMERCSSVLAFENLPEGKATVGFEVCVKHVAAALEGSECTVSSELREIADERKLFFDVEVREGERTIGVGTHERRVIGVGGVKSR